MTNSPQAADPDDLSAQIVRLEEKLAHQQRSYDELNDVVLQQQAELDRMRKEVQSFRQLLQGLLDRGQGEDIPHEKPPHY